MNSMDSSMITHHSKNANTYWLNRFQLGTCGSNFPSDRRPRSRSYEHSRTSASIPGPRWSKFVATCTREGIEPGYAVLGLLQILLRRYTFADTVELGMQAGSFLPVRIDIADSPTVRCSLQRTGLAAEEASANACSWEDLQRWAVQAGIPAEQPLISVLLSVAFEKLEADDQVRIPEPARAQSQLIFSLRCHGVQTELEAEYDHDLYIRDTVDNLLSQLIFLIESLEVSLDQPVDIIPLCSADQARRLAEEVNCNTGKFLVSQCMHQRFEDQVRKTPDAIAVVMPGDARQQLTYSQLNADANRLAHHLRAMGVGPEAFVGLYLDRTPELIVALLAIVKAGAAYLPIDLSYPPERVAFMLSDAESPVVITDSQTALKLTQTHATVICMDKDQGAWVDLSSDNPCVTVKPENLLYSIFTSGSTGTPKGVLITHANVSRLFDATQEWFNFNEQDTWTFFHSSAFDFSVWEIWGALIYGGRVIIVPFADSRSPERFYELLAAEHVTVLNQTPSAFRQLVGIDESKQLEKLDDLRLVIFGGEALNLQSLAPWFKKYGDVRPQLVNMYGITETTVHVTYRPLSASDLTEAPGSVIGRPIPDLQLHVLDSRMCPVPVGVPGEVFVGGGGVARGYLKRDSLTAERFIKNPFSDRENEKTLYRSGDLARRLPGGDLEYMGRADQQVKIRGFRIELGEVQSALTRQPNVREAFVLAKQTCDAEKVLVAYVVPANGEAPAVDKLRYALQSTLPAYMVPSQFVFLEQMPLTANGKIDRAALPAARMRRAELEQPFCSPQTEIERDIVGIYQRVLRIDKVGIDDNFFDLGGNSLRLAEAHPQLEKLVGRRFPLTELFVHTTVRKLAASFSQAKAPDSFRGELLNRAARQRQAMSAGRNRRS